MFISMTQPPKRDLTLDAGTGYLLSRAAALIRRRWAQALASQNLTPHHYGVLMALDEAGPIGPAPLCALIGMDPRNLGPILNGLTGRGLLTRHSDPTDRRRRILALTNSGRAQVADLCETGADLEQQVLQDLGPDDRATLRRILFTLLASAAGEEHHEPR
jgi:DNA-binding MarR family transcriptional regulator